MRQQYQKWIIYYRRINVSSNIRPGHGEQQIEKEEKNLNKINNNENTYNKWKIEELYVSVCMRECVLCESTKKPTSTNDSTAKWQQNVKRDEMWKICFSLSLALAVALARSPLEAGSFTCKFVKYSKLMFVCWKIFGWFASLLYTLHTKQINWKLYVYYCIE